MRISATKNVDNNNTMEMQDAVPTPPQQDGNNAIAGKDAEDIDDEVEIEEEEEEEFDDTADEFHMPVNQLGDFKVAKDCPSTVYKETITYLAYAASMGFGIWRIRIVGKRSKLTAQGCYPLVTGGERVDVKLDPACYGLAACNGSWVHLVPKANN